LCQALHGAGLFPKIFFRNPAKKVAVRKYKDKDVAHWRKSAWEFFYATTIYSWAYIKTPVPCVSGTGQAGSRAFDKGKALGSGTA
jgi:hypothetical protein